MPAKESDTSGRDQPDELPPRGVESGHRAHDAQAQRARNETTRSIDVTSDNSPDDTLPRHIADWTDLATDLQNARAWPQTKSRRTPEPRCT